MTKLELCGFLTAEDLLSPNATAYCHSAKQQEEMQGKMEGKYNQYSCHDDVTFS